jgi:hypothetical protein
MQQLHASHCHHDGIALVGAALHKAGPGTQATPSQPAFCFEMTSPAITILFLARKCSVSAAGAAPRT